MKSKLSIPPGPIMRRIEGLAVGVCGLASFLVYLYIRFDLCATHRCTDLAVTRFHAALPELYLLYAVATLVTGVFLYSNEQVNRGFRLGIETAILSGFVLSATIVFGMLIEIKNVN